jgi:hypothetical protein
MAYVSSQMKSFSLILAFVVAGCSSPQVRHSPRAAASATDPRFVRLSWSNNYNVPGGVTEIWSFPEANNPQAMTKVGETTNATIILPNRWQSEFFIIRNRYPHNIFSTWNTN